MNSFLKMLAYTQIVDLLKTIPAGYKPPDDELFSITNKLLSPAFKKLGVITNVEDFLLTERPANATEFYCNASGCQLVFEGVAAYQTHFNSVHRYICAECRRSLPTAHLLDLHISERHDSYFAARVERGEAMYACFLEECKQKMSTHEKRKEHCISVHKFPINYRFDQLSDKAISGRREEKRAGGASSKSARNPQSAVSANKLQRPPVSIKEKDAHKIKAFCFGHPKEKAFHNKNKKSGDTLNDMHELQNALEELSQ